VLKPVEKSLLNPYNLTKIIKIREQSILLKNEAQQEFIKNQLNIGKITPRTYETKQINLKLLLNKEKSSLKK
jgi:hypothetical protein